MGAGRIEHSDEQKRKKIEGWVGSVNGIHKDKPPATVSYKHKMPDIEALMQACAALHVPYRIGKAIAGRRPTARA